MVPIVTVDREVAAANSASYPLKLDTHGFGRVPILRGPPPPSAGLPCRRR